MFHLPTWISCISCLELMTSEGSTEMDRHFKWARALWELLSDSAVYCLCCQLLHKLFVPAFIWDFSRFLCVRVCVKISLCPFIHKYFLVSFDRCSSCKRLQAVDWRVRKLRVISPPLSLWGNWQCRSHPATLSAPTTHYSHRWTLATLIPRYGGENKQGLRGAGTEVLHVCVWAMNGVKQLWEARRRQSWKKFG